MRVALFWSGGKDSAWAFQRMREGWLSARAESCEVVALLTTYDRESRRLPQQELPLSVPETQARALGLPLLSVALPPACPNAQYEQAVLALVDEARTAHQIEALAFGDLYLSDIRSYRERIFAGSGLALLFPLWVGSDTVLTPLQLQAASLELARGMLAGGLYARISVAPHPLLSHVTKWQAYDDDFIAALPAGIDPCGERGEFHTMVMELRGCRMIPR